MATALNANPRRSGCAVLSIRGHGHRRTDKVEGEHDMIDYRDSLAGLSPSQLVGFFEGWKNPPTPVTHLCILRGSSEIVFAFDTELDRVVGYITAISDGVLSAYIPLLEVISSHRSRGIGSELVRRMIRKLEGLYMIDLVCDSSSKVFYEPLGMSELIGMVLRNLENQSGRE